MAKTYPHKQTIVVAIICAIAIGGTVAYAHWQVIKNPTDMQLTATPNKEVVPADLTSNSTSSNDWRKAFFTLENSSSTSFIATKNTTKISSASLTLTDQLSRNFFSSFMELKQNNLDTNQQLVQDSIDRTLYNSLQAAKQAKTYSTKDILVSNTVDLISLRSYANTLGNILYTNMPRVDAASVAYDALQQSNLSKLGEIDPIVAQYKNTISGVLKVNVPQSLIQIHLQMLNSIESLMLTSIGLKNIETDAMQSMVSLSTYVNAQNSFEDALISIGGLLKSSNVTFGTGEPGTLFTTAKK